MLELSIKARLKSGAEIVLTKEQNDTITRWAEGLLMHGVATKEKNVAPKKEKMGGRYKTNGSQWSKEDHAKLVALSEKYPPRSPGRVRAMTLLAREIGRSVPAIEARISTEITAKKKEAERTAHIPVYHI